MVMKNVEILEPLIQDILQDRDAHIEGEPIVEDTVHIDFNVNVSVRFDVYCKTKDKHIDVEAQVYPEKFLLQRARMYSSVLDAYFQDISGKDMNSKYDVDGTYVIFFCSNSSFPFKSNDIMCTGTMVYKNMFGEVCSENDGRNIIFVNYDKMSDYVPSSNDYDHVIAISDFMSNGLHFTKKGDYVESVYNVILRAGNDMKGVSAMLLSEYECNLRDESREYGREEGREEGRREGREEGREEVIELILKIRELRASGYSDEEISRKLNLPAKYSVLL